MARIRVLDTDGSSVRAREADSCCSCLFCKAPLMSTFVAHRPWARRTLLYMRQAFLPLLLTSELLIALAISNARWLSELRIRQLHG